MECYRTATALREDGRPAARACLNFQNDALIGLTCPQSVGRLPDLPPALLLPRVQLHREHRDRAAVDAFDGEGDGVVALPGADHVEQRQVVVGRGDGEERVAAERLVVDEGL